MKQKKIFKSILGLVLSLVGIVFVWIGVINSYALSKDKMFLFTIVSVGGLLVAMFGINLMLKTGWFKL